MRSFVAVVGWVVTVIPRGHCPTWTREEITARRPKMKTLEAEVKTKAKPATETLGITQSRSRSMAKHKEVAESVEKVVSKKSEEVAVPTRVKKAGKGGSNEQTLQNLIAALDALPPFTHKKRLFKSFVEVFDVMSPEGEEGMAVIEGFIANHIRPQFRLKVSVVPRLVKAVRDFREIHEKGPKLVAGLQKAWIECLVENGLIAPVEE
jgi:hypothetical protein